MVMDGPMGTNTTMTDIQNDIMILQNWFSPAFPTGAFSYSHGLETAIQEELVTDRNSLFSWVSFLLSNGSGRNGWTLSGHARGHSDVRDSSVGVGHKPREDTEEVAKGEVVKVAGSGEAKVADSAAGSGEAKVEGKEAVAVG